MTVELKDIEDEVLIEELEKRKFHVFDHNPEDEGCAECEARLETKPANDRLEAIHYMLAGGKNDEAIVKMKELIYDEIGRVS